MQKLGDVAKGIVPHAPAATPKGAEVRAANDETPLETALRPAPLSARAPNRGYLARELVQCTLPHRDPKTDVYIRTDGKYRLMIESGTNIRTGEKFGLPSGTLPRLLMLYVNTEAVRKQGREDELMVSFGNTMNEFLRNVGCNPATGGGKRGDAARIREQHTRLFNARFTFAQIDGSELFGSEIRKPMEIAQEIRTFWDYRHPEQGTLWESFIVLTREFHAALIANPVPYDFDHLKALKRSSLAIDLYCWLTYRLYRANNDGFTVPYKALFQQFGTGYTRMDNFKAALAEALVLVTEVYDAIRYEFTSFGLAVDPISRRALPVPAEPSTLFPGAVPPTPGQAMASRALGMDTRYLVIMPADLRKVDRLARGRGLDVDDMLQRWKNWCIEEGVRPTNPAAHFTSFVKSHNPSRD